MRHIYIFVLMLIVAALVLFSPTQSYPEPTQTVCITVPFGNASGCYINEILSEEECILQWASSIASIEEDEFGEDLPWGLDTEPRFYSPSNPFGSEPDDEDMWDNVCVTGCCRLFFDDGMTDDEETVTEWYCENRDWGENVEDSRWYGPEDGGVCPDPFVTTCIVGQRGPGCVCGNRNLESGEYCCQGNVISGQACATSEPEVPDGDELWQVPETCGNDQLDLPGEECDGRHVDACTATEGSPASCTPACRCAINDYDQYDGYCHPSADCARDVICAETEGPVVTASSITATDQALVSWEDSNFVEACEAAFLEFEVIIDGFGAQSFGPEARNMTFTVASETTYTITVEAIYDDGTSASDSIAFTSGHEMCFTEQRAFCAEATQEGQPSTQRWVCDIRNDRTSEACTGGHCYPTLDPETEIAGAVCSPIVDCDLCSGAYANFGEARGDVVVSIEQGDDSLNLRCDQLDRVPSEFGDIAYCHLDFTRTALQEYASCSIATGCFQYRSQSACESNTCGVPPGECEWNAEFGFCSTDSVAHQTCGSETEDACLAEGASCQWVTGSGGSRCERNRGYCEDYRTQDACTGGTNFALAQNDYTEIARSNDALGLGKCVWQEAQDRCIKDADSDGNQDPLIPLRLRTDFTNPVTSLRGSPATQTYGTNVAIPYIVSKPVRYTYTRLNPGACGTITSPPTSAANVDQEARTISYRNVADGQHCLQYYSQDASRNTEQVQQVTITVDSRALIFEDVNYSLRPSAVRADGTRLTTVDFTIYLNRQATCQFSFTGEGVTSEDTRYYTGMQHVRIYEDLADGQYTLESTCWITGHEPITETTVVLIDSDTRMTQPIPPLGTYTNQIITAEFGGVGIHTQDPNAVCRVTHGPNTYTLQAQETVFVDGEAFTPHTTDEIEFGTGVHVLTPTCEFADFTLSASPADLIIFAIDEQPPNTIVRFEEDGQNYTFTGGDVTVGLEGRDVQVVCRDPEITGRDRNWESECAATFLRITGDGTGFTEREPNFTFRLEPEQSITVYSVDGLGNVGAERTFTGVDVDVSGPGAERFWIERDSEGQR